jgi:hypothetical protein
MLATGSTPVRLPLGGACLISLLLTPACKDDDPPGDVAATDTNGTTGSSGSGTDTLPDDALTWWRDVEPIVRHKCAGCHLCRLSASRGELDAVGTDEAGWSKDRRVDIALAK